jgi:histidinol dehydrogenase
MRILEWSRLSAGEQRAALERPVQRARNDIEALVREVMSAVRARGDTAVREYTHRFDGADLENPQVEAPEFAAARRAVGAAQRTALERAIENVDRFHRTYGLESLSIETAPGVRCERLYRPIGAVGLYVPAGSAPLPSAVVMLAVPARIAGCPQRVLCTPPDRTGRAHPAVLLAAELCGVGQVFKVGGAQAIAALAYGTDRIPKVDKIFGPGNAWVTAAKLAAAADPLGAACDMPAGPSEVMVLADASARPEFIAADLLAQAEHDINAQAILVTPSAPLAEAVGAAVGTQMRSLSRGAILAHSIKSSRALVVADLDTAVAVANAYAAEHLILEVREPRALLPRIVNAGSIFLGAWSPEPMGDYCTGTNHVLPTYGYARAYSGLGVPDYLKRITVQELTPAGLRALGPTAITLAQLEGLDAHAAAVACRLRALETGAVAPLAAAGPRP